MDNIMPNHAIYLNRYDVKIVNNDQPASYEMPLRDITPVVVDSVSVKTLLCYEILASTLTHDWYSPEITLKCDNSDCIHAFERLMTQYRAIRGKGSPPAVVQLTPPEPNFPMTLESRVGSFFINGGAYNGANIGAYKGARGGAHSAPIAAKKQVFIISGASIFSQIIWTLASAGANSDVFVDLDCKLVPPFLRCAIELLISRGTPVSHVRIGDCSQLWLYVKIKSKISKSDLLRAVKLLNTCKCDALFGDLQPQLQPVTTAAAPAAVPTDATIMEQKTIWPIIDIEHKHIDVIDGAADAADADGVAGAADAIIPPFMQIMDFARSHNADPLVDPLAEPPADAPTAVSDWVVRWQWHYRASISS